MAIMEDFHQAMEGSAEISAEVTTPAELAELAATQEWATVIGLNPFISFYQRRLTCSQGSTGYNNGLGYGLGSGIGGYGMGGYPNYNNIYGTYPGAGNLKL